MRIFPVLALILILSLAGAVPLKMVAPLQKTVGQGDIISIGTIGPGQTIEVQISPYVTEGGIYGEGGTYDLAYVSAKPDGWSSESSKLYGTELQPLQVKITADESAPEGLYNVDITVEDENNGEELGNITFTVMVKITWDVLDVDVKPSAVLVGPGQPAQFMITVMNQGSASDTYTVSATGARQWEFLKSIYIPAKSSRTVRYELTAHEEESYSPTIKVVSASSPNIHSEENVSLTVRSDLIGDYKATNNGVLLFPIFEAPVYSFSGLIAALLGSLGF